MTGILRSRSAWLLVCATALLVLVPATAQSRTLTTFSNASAITIADNASTSSTIIVSGAGPVTNVTVKLLGFTHTAPDDVDLLLVGPSGDSALLMSDVGGDSDVSGLNLTFSDASLQALADEGPLATGTFRPTNSTSDENDDIFPAPAPEPSTTALSIFNGTSANGNWKLYVADDDDGESGSISGGWQLVINEAPSCPAGTRNCTPITIDDESAGTPFPSVIHVSGFAGSVGDANVTLYGLAHGFPDDIDVLLVAPTGEAALLMSDVGGDPEASGIDLTFDDEAASSLPDAGPLTAGSFKPTNVGAGDSFPPYAPDGPYSSPLSVFDGLNPNGDWSLFVVDDGSGDAGSFTGGWSLQLTPAAPTAVVVKQFRAQRAGTSVKLSWRTVGETILAGFNVYRSSSSGFVRLNKRLIRARHTGSSAGFYSFVDSSRRAAGTHRYRLEAISTRGKPTIVGVSAPVVARR